MTSVATAKAFPIDGPIPLAPRHSLLSMMQEIGSVDWYRGVAPMPYPFGVPVAEDPCDSGSLALKGTPEGTTLPGDFPAFMGYLGEICTTMSIDWDAWTAKANAAFNARRSWLLERQLMNGTYVTQKWLGDSDANVITGALATRAAVAQLEALGAQTGQEYWLHVPPEVAAHGGYNLFQEDRTGILRTASGAPVVVGTGYSQDDNTPASDLSFAPVGAPPLGQLPAGDRKSWIYVSGPIQARVGDTLFLNPATLTEARDWAQNTVVYRAEQTMVVAWDGQLQGAVLADWSGA